MLQHSEDTDYQHSTNQATMSQHPEDRRSNDPLPVQRKLKILQWNIQGLRGKAHEVQEAIFREGMDIVLLQETLVPASYTFRVTGYSVHALPKGEGRQGCMTLVRNTLPHQRISRPADCGEGVEVVAVELDLPSTKLEVYNIYRSQRHILELGELLTLASQENILVAGDFNGHHPVLQSISQTNLTGRHLAHLLEEVPNIRLLNNGEATHRDGGRLDLTLASETLAEGANWWVHPHLMSDHSAIVTTLQLQLPPRMVLPPRWLVQRADWTAYRKHMEDWWATYIPSEDLDQLEEDLTQALTRAADAAIPKSSPNHHHRRDWWFRTERVIELRSRVRAVQKVYKRYPTPANRSLLAEVVADCRRGSREAKENKWLEWCASFDEHTSLGALWTKIRVATGKRPSAPPAHSDPLGEAERLTVHFAERGSTEQLPRSSRILLEALRPGRMNRVAAAIEEQDETDHPFTMEELQRNRTQRPDTASGADGITYSMLQTAGRPGDEAFLQVLNRSWREGRLPYVWKGGDIRAIRKHSDPVKLRPLTLLRCMAKQAENLVRARLEWRIGPLHPHLFGFTRGRSTIDSITNLLSLIDNSPAVVVFLDMEKAFELACADSILEALVKRGVKGRLLAWLSDYLRGRHARVKFQGQVANYHDFPNGTPQGGILSPLLFNLLMAILVSLVFPENVELLSYADDLVLVVKGTAANKIEKAQQALTRIVDECDVLGLKVSAVKTHAMVFRAKDPQTHLHIRHTQVEWVKEHQYLGVWLDKGLKFSRQVTYLVERMNARHSMMRAMTRPLIGASPAVLRLYYIHAIRPLVDYSAPTLITLSDKMCQKLEVVQNKAMRTILGAPRWTSITIMLSELGLVPLKDRITQLMAGRVASILNRGSDTEAQKKLRNLQGHIPNKSRWIKAAVNSIVTLVDVWPLLTQGPDVTSPTYTESPPWEETKLEVTYTRLPSAKAHCLPQEMRQQALMGMDSLQGPHHAVYYTDGSVNPTTGTAGAACISNGVSVAWRTSDHSSTLQTELVGILAALDNAQNRPEPTVVIHTDSKTALQSLKQRRHKDNIQVVTTILGMVQGLVDNGRRVIINWIPSHVGLHGNERADELARRASSRPVVDYVVLPSIRQMKAKARHTTRTLACQAQRQAEGTLRSAAWYAKTSGRSPLNPTLQRCRRDATHLHRLRLGYRTWAEINHPQEPRECEHCNQPSRQPLLHYLTECQATVGLRSPAAPPGAATPEETAARIVYNLTESRDPEPFLAILRKAPPPR